MAIRISDQFMVEVPTHGGALNEGVVGLPRTINPVLAVTDVDRDLSTLIYAGLMKYKDGQLTADIAESYSISDDGLTYDFKLRPNVNFQDGSALTADDIEFTIQKIQDPALKSPRRADWTNVTVKKISTREIQFILKQPYSPFLINTTLGILPKHIWGAVSDDQFIFSQFNIEPIGAGPYKAQSIVRDSGGIPTQYILGTWGGYFNKEPFVKKIVFHFFADEEKALSALDTSGVDSLSAVSPAAAKRLASDSAQPYRVIQSPLPRIFGVFLNQNQQTIFADKNIRQALNIAIPRKTLVSSILNGYGIAIDSPLPVGILNTALNATTSVEVSMDADPASARALIEKSGWKRGVNGIYIKKAAKTATTTLAFELDTSDAPDLQQTAEAIKNACASIGIQVTVKVFESSDLYQNIIRTRKYDALLFGEQIGKDRDLYAFWHSSQRNAPGLNVSMYANSKVDKILEDIRSTNDDKARMADYAALDQQISADLPAIFIYSPDFIYVIPKSLKGISLGSVTVPADRWGSVDNWYIATEKVWKYFDNR